MNLYLIHCGFYDEEHTNGLYEFHVNIPIAAHSLEEAKKKVRQEPLFVKKKMHIDGIEHLKKVSGFLVNLLKDGSSTAHESETHLHRDL